MDWKHTLLLALLSFFVIWLVEAGASIIGGASLLEWWQMYKFTVWGSLIFPIISYLGGILLGALFATLLEDVLKFPEIEYNSSLTLLLVPSGSLIVYLLLKYFFG